MRYPTAPAPNPAIVLQPITKTMPFPTGMSTLYAAIQNSGIHSPKTIVAYARERTMERASGPCRSNNVSLYSRAMGNLSDAVWVHDTARRAHRHLDVRRGWVVLEGRGSTR